jgi:hypothetical protein
MIEEYRPVKADRMMIRTKKGMPNQSMTGENAVLIPRRHHAAAIRCCTRSSSAS